MGFNFTQLRLTCSTLRYVLAPTDHQCTMFSSLYCCLVSDDIFECVLSRKFYELMEINFADQDTR